jgi:hypothetical protein
MAALLGAVGGFVVLLTVLVALRVWTGNRIEVKTSDMVLALVPIGLWLFTTGKVQELTVGDVKIVAAIKQASTSPVDRQVTRLPVDPVRADPKEGLSQLSELKRKSPQALSFQLGYGRYYGPVIRQYLDELTSLPSFRYIVLNRPDGTLFGLLDARQFTSLLKTGSGQVDPDRFAEWLNQSSTTELSSLPSFIPAKDALRKTSETRTALELMNSLDIQTLPVIDDAGRFIGVVDRSKLSANMLIDIAARVGG